MRYRELNQRQACRLHFWRGSFFQKSFSGVELFQVLIPFHGKQLFFGIVALFAAWHDIAFGAFSAAGYGHNVIHGQLFGQSRSPTVVTGSFGQSSFPPLGIPQLPGLAALSFQIIGVQIIGKGFYGFFAFHN